MLSFDISIRATDSHAIFELDSGKVRRSSAPVTIGPFVWLGEGVQVLKGSTVGAGSVVGASATVVGEIGPTSLAIGTPARVVQTGVSWTRSPSPTPSDLARRRSALARLGISCPVPARIIEPA